MTFRDRFRVPLSSFTAPEVRSRHSLYPRPQSQVWLWLDPRQPLFGGIEKPIPPAGRFELMCAWLLMRSGKKRVGEHKLFLLIRRWQPM